MAHKKAGGSSKNGRDSESKRLGVKVFGGQTINAGGIIDVYHQRNGSPDALKQEHIRRIESNLREVLARADECHMQTHTIAEQLSEEILQRSPADSSSLAA